LQKKSFVDPDVHVLTTPSIYYIVSE